ncbi:TPA: hypothetical protein ACG0RR_000935 [Pseudomonas aeruginosa]
MKTSLVVDEAYRQRVRDVAEATEGKIFVTPVWGLKLAGKEKIGILARTKDFLGRVKKNLGTRVEM